MISTCILAALASFFLLWHTTLSGLPSREELLIFALGLGGSGNNYDPINHPPQPIPVRPAGLFCSTCLQPDSEAVVDNRRCPHNGRNGQICSHIPGV